MAGRLTQIKDEFVRQLRILSISATVAVHLIYTSYLLYALKNDIGNKYVNIALAVGTAVFLIAYLALRLMGKDKKSVKTTKRFYKRFKLFMKVFTVATAVYTLVTAAGSVSPLASLFANISAAVLCVRLLIEFILSFIERRIRRIKEKFSAKIKKGAQPEKEEIITEECLISEADLQ